MHKVDTSFRGRKMQRRPAIFVLHAHDLAVRTRTRAAANATERACISIAVHLSRRFGAVFQQVSRHLQRLDL